MTRSLFERLDKNSLQSGILLQQSAMFVNPFRFDGTALNDSNRMDAGRFGKLFGQLRAASTAQPVLPDPAVYLDLLRRNMPLARTATFSPCCAIVKSAGTVPARRLPISAPTT